MKTITTKELKELFDLFIKKLEDEDVLEITIESDLYRFVPTDKWDSFTEDIIEQGSLYDDIDSLQNILQNNHIPFTYVDVDRLSFILRIISQINNPPN